MANNLRRLPDTFWAWLAGFIDGDGSIGFYRRPYGQPICSIQISQKNRETLEEITSKLGTGSICIQRLHNGLPYWQLHFGSRASRAICAKILPFLRDDAKKARARSAAAWKRLEPGEIANSPEQRASFDDAVAAYTAGRSPAEIAITFGVSQQSILRWAARSGVKKSAREAFRLRGIRMRGKQKKTKLSAKRARAIQMRAKGMSGPAIAKELGVSVNNVYYWLKVAEQQPPSSS